MEKKMETTTMGLYRDYNRVYILGLYWDNGEENGNYYYIILGYMLGFYMG